LRWPALPRSPYVACRTSPWDWPEESWTEEMKGVTSPSMRYDAKMYWIYTCVGNFRGIGPSVETGEKEVHNLLDSLRPVDQEYWQQLCEWSSLERHLPPWPWHTDRPSVVDIQQDTRLFKPASVHLGLHCDLICSLATASPSVWMQRFFTLPRRYIESSSKEP
jgi:hypothetical protein